MLGAGKLAVVTVVVEDSNAFFIGGHML